MLIFCKECRNYYEDTVQSPECGGIGVSRSPMSSHENIRGCSAAEEANATAKHSNNTRRTLVADAEGGNRVETPRLRPVAVPTDHAAPSDA